MSLHYTSKGITYLCIEWFFNFWELTIVSLRLYSRTFLTRLVGSDDFAIIIECVRCIKPECEGSHELI